MESKTQNLIRIDLWLVEKGLAPSRSKAQELIDEKRVEIFKHQWQTIEQSSVKVPRDLPSDQVRVDREEVLRFVSRGGRKLQGALRDFSIDVNGKNVLDLGQSTGGFSDCVLQQGAQCVVGIDVGRGQLDPRLAQDSRVTSLEEINLKELKEEPRFLQKVPPGGFQLTVCDLSFISSRQHLRFILGWSDHVLLLVKPQFELGPAALNKKGLVQNRDLISDLMLKFESDCHDLGYGNCRWANSQIAGRDGNQELFLYVQRQ